MSHTPKRGYAVEAPARAGARAPHGPRLPGFGRGTTQKAGVCVL